MKHTIFALIGMLFLQTGIAEAQISKKAGTLLVDDSFAAFEFLSWTGDSGSASYQVRTKIVNYEGFIALCGAGYLDNASFRSINNRALRDYSLFMDGKPILKGLSFFKYVRKEEMLDTAIATCRVSTTPVSEWSPESDFDFISRKSRYSS